jgi:ribosome-associated translation inhibitor RaiA
MAQPKEFTDLPIEYYNEVNDDPELFDEIDRRLRKLADGHQDIVGASVNIKPTDQGRDTETDVSIVVYTSPHYTNATARNPQPIAAVKGALDHIERQVRETRAKLRGY